MLECSYNKNQPLYTSYFIISEKKVVKLLKTLRSKLLFFILLTTFLSVLVVGYISYEAQRNVITKQIEQSFYMFSDSLALSVEELIIETVHDVNYLSELTVLKNENSTKEEIRSEFEKFVTYHRIYNDIILVNRNGIVEIDMLGGVVEGSDFNDRLWFQHTMKGETFFSDVYLSPVINKPILVMGAPVKDNDNNIIGAVSPSLNLEQFWQRIYEFSDLQKQIGIDGLAFLFNDKGEVIAHPNTENIMEANYFNEKKIDIQQLIEKSDNKSLYFSETSNEVVAYSKISQVPGFNNNWYIGVSTSKDKLYSPLNKLLISYILFLGLVLIVAIFGIIKFANYLVNPVEKLVDATAHLADGKRYTPITVNSYKEINILNEQFNYMVGQLQDRERAHKKSTLILETTDNGIFAFDKETMRITTFNKTCEKLFTTGKEVVLGRTISDVCKLNYRFNTFVKESRLIEKIEEVYVSYDFECRCPVNGDVTYFSLNMTALPKPIHRKEKEILVVFSDLSEKKLMEKEMVRTEKLKVIGELSASFAHEIRNPLTTIRGFIQLMDVSERSSDFEKKYYKIILLEIDRINGIVGDLMDMAKPSGDKQYMSSNLNKIIEDITLLYDGQGSINNIEIVKKLDKAVPAFYTYGSKLKQVFINIIKNAFEAMPDGGTLSITTQFVEKENAVEVLFTDSGIGMDEKTLSSIGKPFFTTKETGTGLGIPMCYMIIEDLGGSIAVNSKQGEGTTFRVKLIIDEETYSSQNTNIKTIGM